MQIFSGWHRVLVLFLLLFIHGNYECFFLFVALQFILITVLMVLKSNLYLPLSVAAAFLTGDCGSTLLHSSWEKNLSPHLTAGVFLLSLVKQLALYR